VFVWLRLYQQQMQDLVLSGRDQPLWWTLRRPFCQQAGAGLGVGVAAGPVWEWTSRDALQEGLGQRGGGGCEKGPPERQWAMVGGHGVGAPMEDRLYPGGGQLVQLDQVTRAADAADLDRDQISFTRVLRIP
jgi:hypothetical protein